MAFLRFALVTLVVFLLLGPLIRYLDISIEPPVLAVVVDNSSSMVMGEDSASSAQAINSALEKLRSDLDGTYDLVTYTFSGELLEESQPDFIGPVTDISEVLSSLKVRYANRNLGATVLLSDGIYNRGNNPRYTVENFPSKVYTVAFGDTTLRRDARIAETAANRVAYLGNGFPVEMSIEAYQLEGQTAVLSISQGGKRLFSEEIDYGQANFRNTYRAVLEAEKPGLQRFDISLSLSDGDSNESNNYRTVFVDVIDDRREVLILGNSPHPDLKAMRESISSNVNYNVEVTMAGEASGDYSNYDLIILHQLPSRTAAGQRIRRDLKSTDTPLLAVVGGQTALSTLDEFNFGVSLPQRTQSTNDVNGSVNPNFTLFELPEDIGDLISNAPPLRIPFGDWQLANSSETLLFQKVGRITTEDPLLVFNTPGDKKRSILLGEGLWRWRLADYAMHENHEKFDGFFTGIVQYLAVKEDKRLFRVEGPDRVRENESLIFRAELYTPSYEPVNDSEVNLVITDEEDREFPFSFSPRGDAYRLDAGVLPPGNYRYTAGVKRGGRTYTDAGSFAVTTFELENSRTRADHALLFAIADVSGGRMVTPLEIDRVSAELLDEDSAPKPISYNSEIFSSLLNFKWLFFLLLLLLTGEWFLRKYLGKY